MWELAFVGISENKRAGSFAKKAIKVDTDLEIPLSKFEGKSIVWKMSKRYGKSGVINR